MFILLDLYTGAIRRAESKIRLAELWLEATCSLNAYTRCQMDFDSCDKTWLFQQLNITGNDTYPIINHDNSPDVATRRYMVLDADGRHIDIREWPRQVWLDATARPKYSASVWSSGKKSHAHRTHGAAMFRGTMKQKQSESDILEILEDEGLDAMEKPGFAPVLNHIKIRKKNGLARSMLTGDFYARKANRKYAGDKSWKRQSKSPRQYAKHKTWDAKALRKTQYINAKLQSVDCEQCVELKPGQDDAA